jgi:hypothetical protein
LKKLSLVIIATLVLVAVPAFAQEADREERSDTGLRTELRLNGWMFENFFQASEPASEEDVSALGAELRVAGGGRSGWSPYARANYLKYDDEGLDSTYGGRVGLALDSNPHSFDVYADHQLDRPTFDIGDVFDRADVTTVAAEYRNRITRSWDLGVEGQFQQQSFQELTSKDNEFTGFGASVRYRGFGSIFSPEIGFMMGEREVDDPSETYDQNDTYIQVRSTPVDALYLSVRYRMREREYTTGDPLASSFGRTDDRDQLSLSGDWKLTPRLTLNGYFANEKSDSSREGRDFDTGLYMLGLTIGF